MSSNARKWSLIGTIPPKYRELWPTFDTLLRYIDDKLAAISGLTWAAISGKPSVFPPDTHGHTSSEITDFAEAAQDVVGAMLTDSSTIDFTYDDATGTFTAVVQGLDSGDIGDFSEAVQDEVAALLLQGSNITLTYNDALGTLTIDAAGGGDAIDITYDNTTSGATATDVQAAIDELFASSGGGGSAISGDSTRVVRSTSQTITAATYTAVSWSSESWDTAAMWAGGNPTRLVAQRDGKYLIGANLNFGTGTVSNGLGCWWTKNGQSPASSSAYRRGGQWFTAGQNSAELTTSHVLELAAGDYVELWIYSVDGTTLDPAGDAEGSVAWMIELAGRSLVERTFGASWGSSAALVAANCADVYVRVPFACTIAAAHVLTQGGTGSCVIDVRKDTFANFPPTGADSIAASAKPTVTADVKSTDTTLTGWTVAVSAGDVLAFHVDSTSTFTGISVILDVVPT